MEKINLVFEEETFPQIYKRYTPDDLRQVLVKMCEKANLEITERHLYSMATHLESDLRHMFP